MSARIARSNPAMKLILVSTKSFCSSSPWCADPCDSLEHRDTSCWQEEWRSSPLNYFYRRDFCPNVDYFWATRDFRYMWGSWVCAINPHKKARLSQIKCYVPFARHASVQAVWWCRTHYRCQLLSVHFGALSNNFLRFEVLVAIDIRVDLVAPSLIMRMPYVYICEHSQTVFLT